MLATINWFDKKMEIDFFMFNTHTGPPETSLILYFHVCLGSVIFYNVTFDKCLWIIIVHRHVQTVHGFLTSMCCNITTRIKYMKISNLTQIKTEYFEKSIVKTGRKKSIGSEFLILCPEIRKTSQELRMLSRSLSVY